MSPEPRAASALEKVARALDVALLERIVAAANAKGADEQEKMAEDLAVFFRTLRRTRLPQMTASVSERVHARRTLRDVLRHGGRLVRPHYEDRVRERRLVALFDCSESTLSHGLAVLACAVQRIDPRVVVLGFDAEVFALRGGSVASVYREFESRCRDVLRGGRSFLSLAHLDTIVRQAARFSPNAAQSYLLIFSDLFIEPGTAPGAGQLNRLRALLQRYRRCWVVDARATGWPFVESFEDGVMTCSAGELLAFLDRAPGGAPARLKWRLAETRSERFEFARNVLVRWEQARRAVVLEAVRFTPWLRRIGFVTDQPASGKLTYVPQDRPLDLAAVFRDTNPF